MTRPNMELMDFRRVALKPGETKTVTFSINTNKFAFLDKNMCWKIEAGEFEILIGASSDDIRLIGEVTIANDSFISGKERV